MTSVEPPRADAPSEPSPLGRPARSRSAAQARIAGRSISVVVIVAALIASILARMWALSRQDVMSSTSPYAAAASDRAGRTPSFGNMDSFALALLLGGLRGPLVMCLWMQSESQKNDRDLEDITTIIEWIRRLQPEFDRVHVFQMWNEAYNISVQMASLSDRYSSILEALQYGREMDATRPNDINLMLAMGQVYYSKLGNTTGDKVYYNRQVRMETRWRTPNTRLPNAPQRELEPMLDEGGNLLPRYITPRLQRRGDLSAFIFVPPDQADAFRAAVANAGVTIAPGKISTLSRDMPYLHPGSLIVTTDEATAKRLDQPANEIPGVLFLYGEMNDGSELQYLTRYQPYPDGLSPLALGYNYTKRAEVLLNLGQQAPAELSASYADLAPAEDLRGWCEEEWERATQAEILAFGRQATPGAALADSLLITSGDSPQTPPADALQAAAAIGRYRLASRLARDSQAQYLRHGLHLEYAMQNYSSKLDLLRAAEWMMRGDCDVLIAQQMTPGPQRLAVLAQAAGEYQHSLVDWQYMILRYYTPVEILDPIFKDPRIPQDTNGPFTRETMYRLLESDPARFERFYRTIEPILRQPDPNSEDRSEFSRYVLRAATRVRTLKMLLNSEPATQPATNTANQG